MKRLAPIFVIISLICFSFSSCKKCYTCDFGARGIQKFCSKDFPEGTRDLNLTIQAYKDEGYTCTQN